MFAQVRTAIERTNLRGLVKIIHWSVMGNHLHMIVETDSSDDLRSGIQGFFIRAARLLNALLARRGPVFADRFHSRVLDTPRKVWNALRYVLLNARKHGLVRASEAEFDAYSSAASFDGWTRHLPTRRLDRPEPERPRTWLLRIGWRRHGRVDPTYVPA